MVELHLPWPPSMNTYWRSFRGRVVISSKGVKYRDAVARHISGRDDLFADERLKVEVLATPPDGRQRDIDNLFKALLDSLEHGGAFENDEQIDDLRIVRLPPDPPGGLVVKIGDINNGNSR